MPAARSSAICRLAMSTALPRRLSSVSCALWIAPHARTHSMWLRPQLWMTTGLFLSSSALARMSGVRVTSGVSARSSGLGARPGSGGMRNSMPVLPPPAWASLTAWPGCKLRHHAARLSAGRRWFGGGLLPGSLAGSTRVLTRAAGGGRKGGMGGGGHGSGGGLAPLPDDAAQFVGGVVEFALRLVVAGQDFCADLLCLKRLALGREVGQDGIGVCVDGAEQRADLFQFRRVGLPCGGRGLGGLGGHGAAEVFHACGCSFRPGFDALEQFMHPA